MWAPHCRFVYHPYKVDHLTELKFFFKSITMMKGRRLNNFLFGWRKKKRKGRLLLYFEMTVRKKQNKFWVQKVKLLFFFWIVLQKFVTVKIVQKKLDCLEQSFECFQDFVLRVLYFLFLFVKIKVFVRKKNLSIWLSSKGTFFVVFLKHFFFQIGS